MSTRRKSDLVFSPTVDQLIRDRAGKPLTVFAGGNNTGKSLLLKYIRETAGLRGVLLGVSRFYQINHIAQGLRQDSELSNYFQQFTAQFGSEDLNSDEILQAANFPNLFATLSDVQRASLFQLFNEVFDSTLKLTHVDPANSMSPWQLFVDEQPLAITSTGTRLVLSILALLLDDRFNTVLIDEPELGLSPRVQEQLAILFNDASSRAKHFPHLERLVIATHSQILLARGDFADNYVVSRSAHTITLSQVNTTADFSRLQFNLLGNSLDSLLLPAAIIIVEGKTDLAYLEKVMAIQFPDRRITVTQSGGDPKQKVYQLRDLLGDLSSSPYGSRVFVVLDQVTSPTLEQDLIKLGVPGANITRWSANGIEYLYPNELMKSIFHAGDDWPDKLDIKGDKVTLNGVERTKKQLGVEIGNRLGQTAVLPDELQTKLLDRIRATIR